MVRLRYHWLLLTRIERILESTGSSTKVIGLVYKNFYGISLWNVQGKFKQLPLSFYGFLFNSFRPSSMKGLTTQQSINSIV
jgi:hypothetical protein